MSIVHVSVHFYSSVPILIVIHTIMAAASVGVQMYSSVPVSRSELLC